MGIPKDHFKNKTETCRTNYLLWATDPKRLVMDIELSSF